MSMRDRARGIIAILLIPLSVSNSLPWICCLCSAVKTEIAAPDNSIQCGMPCCPGGVQCCCRRIVQTTADEGKDAPPLLRCSCQRKQYTPVVSFAPIEDRNADVLVAIFDVPPTESAALVNLRIAILRRSLDTGPPQDLVIAHRRLLF